MYPEGKPAKWLFYLRKSHLNDSYLGHVYSGSALGQAIDGSNAVLTF
jgi:hypothetical protein